MSSFMTDQKSSNIAPNYSEDDAEYEDDDGDLQFDGNNLATPFKRNQLNSSYDASNWSASFSELLPAGNILYFLSLSLSFL